MLKNEFISSRDTLRDTEDVEPSLIREIIYREIKKEELERIKANMEKEQAKKRP